MVKSNSVFLNKMYFYWGTGSFEGIKNNTIPAFIPFETDYKADIGLLIQKRRKIVLESLNKAYKLGSDIGNLCKLNPWSNEYGKDFLDFFDSATAAYEGKIREVLEIGCGQECTLLSRMKGRGFNVLGIEPSPLAVRAGRKTGIKVINDFFPSIHLKGRQFDLIFHSGVLEHVKDPLTFLKYQYSHLKEGGILIISTPDYTNSIRWGDISMFLHEHLSYFDGNSLNSCVKKAGFENIQIKRANFGGFLYCTAQKKGKRKFKFPDADYKKTKYNKFLKSYNKLITGFRKYVKNLISQKKTFGFYAPVRSLPYLAALNLHTGFRLFDDNPSWHGKYLRGMDMPIEDFKDLRKNPVSNLIIMSPTFGELIEKRIKKYLKNNVNIRKIKDFI